MDTAIIIPVRNRCETTLRCLSVLQDDGVFQWAVAYVVDDGSTDGTSERVAALFPEVRRLGGDGSLWWTGAVELGMRAAVGDGAEYLLWLNDDTLPEPGACARLRRSAEAHQTLVTGQCRTKEGVAVYGGLRRCGMEFVPAEESPAEAARVDACSGNFAAFPVSVVKAIGYPDARRFPHAFGDLDYSLRVRKRGLGVWADPSVRAGARPNNLKNHASWLLGDIAVVDLWRGLWRKNSYSYAPAHVRFLARHFGWRGFVYWLWTVVKRVPITLLRVLVPRAWLVAAWGGRSRAWREEQRLRSGAGGA